MYDLLDWIKLEEFLALMVLICLLAYVAGQVTRSDDVPRRRGRRMALGALLLYAGFGIHVWAPSSAGDVVLILIRALLASGVVYGVSTIVFSVIRHVIGEPANAVAKAVRQWHADRRRAAAEGRARRDAAQRTRRAQLEDARRAPLVDLERRQRTEEAARADRERLHRTNDARAEVIQYYDDHADLLAETLPPALLHSRLQNRFPAAITPEQAWHAAQEMIAEMLALIAPAREKQRTEQRKNEVEAAEEERKRREPQERRQAIHRLTEWYEEEKTSIEQRLKEGPERDVILYELHDRYDQLMKEALSELTP